MKFQKGQSGNPAGRRSPGNVFSRLVRSHTNNGLELLEFALAVFRGQATEAMPEKPDLAMRWEAMKWLADRGFGKAVEQVAIVEEPEAASATALPVESLEDGLSPTGAMQ